MAQLISIILPNYNHANYLQERLDSIFNQTYQNFEVIILDDCSTDASISILEPYKAHPKASHFVINNQNSGSPFKQWHKGLNVAKGDFIWIAESDDICDLNFLETQLKCLETSDVAVAKTVSYMDDTVKHEIKHPVFEISKRGDAILYCPILNVSSVLFKAELLKNLKEGQYTNYNIIGDRVFYFEYFRDAKIVLNTDTKNYFRQSNSNISKLSNRNLRYYKNYFKEHCKFISYAKNIDTTISRDTVTLYINKFYKRVSNRVSKGHKRSFSFIRLFVLFKLRLLVNKLQKPS